MIKKIIILVLLFVFLYVPYGFSSFCSAQDVTTPNLVDPMHSGKGGLDRFEELLVNILSWLWPISLVVAVLMILIGAYYLVLSGGDPQRAATGRKVIVYALVGVVIITLALGIWEFIKMILDI